MILLDTHVLLWLAHAPDKLSAKATETIQARGRQEGIAIAAISLWEIAWLATNGRLAIQTTVEAFVEKISSRVSVRSITPQIAALACQFPASFPADPADRLIAATALSEGASLITKDSAIRRYSAIRTIW